MTPKQVFEYFLRSVLDWEMDVLFCLRAGTTLTLEVKRDDQPFQAVEHDRLSLHAATICALYDLGLVDWKGERPSFPAMSAEVVWTQKAENYFTNLKMSLGAEGCSS